jgi:glycosyltransferase involved in cell wall biosynthesis
VRIALITATPQSVREGSGTFVAGETLRRALGALGHDVRVVAPTRHAPPFAYTLHRFAFNWGIAAAAVGEADLVVGFDMDGFRLAGRLPVPFVAYIHGILADEARFERGLVAASMRLQSRAESASVRRATRVLTVSRYARNRISDIYGLEPERIAVVPPALDVARWRAALEAHVGRRNPGPTVLCVARMYPRKNIASLVRAAALLRTRVPGVRVRIVGDGPERLRLEGLTRSLDLGTHVRFEGQLDFDGLAQAYAGCDIFCLPSLQEGFGLVFLEAMAAGKPVVCCGDTAVEELVQDGTNGVVVPQRDDAALAEALARLLQDGEARHRMGMANSAVAQQFEPAGVARQFLDAVSEPPTGEAPQ